MGDTASNLWVAPHVCAGQVIGFGGRMHHGAASIDEPLPDATIANFAAYRSAVLNGASDATVHAAGRTAWPDWYEDRVENGPSGTYGSFRVSVLALVAP